MSKPGLSFTFGAKKTSLPKPAPPKRKPRFASAVHDSDPENGTPSKPSKSSQDILKTSSAAVEQAITELDDLEPTTPAQYLYPRPRGRCKNAPIAPPPSLKSKTAATIHMPGASDFKDLSTALTATKNAEAAAALDPSIYDYDEVYDSFKVAKAKGWAADDVDKKSRYIDALKAAAEVRAIDRQIAEDKRIARERVAEGDEFEGKEKFVTEAYKKQQEESRRREEEEKREDEEAKRNKDKGMTVFYKNMLERQDQQHSEQVRAAEERAKAGVEDAEIREAEEDGAQKTKTDAELAKEINDRGGKITINDDDEVVDKRQLLRGGLNISAKKRAEVQQDKARHATESPCTTQPCRGVFAPGVRQAMRERHSGMIGRQLLEAQKRAREEEEEERRKIGLASKSQKTEEARSSARERYLARKRAAEEAKNRLEEV